MSTLLGSPVFAHLASSKASSSGVYLTLRIISFFGSIRAETALHQEQQESNNQIKHRDMKKNYIKPETFSLRDRTSDNNDEMW